MQEGQQARLFEKILPEVHGGWRFYQKPAGLGLARWLSCIFLCFQNQKQKNMS
jgi:hypothetical protein